VIEIAREISLAKIKRGINQKVDKNWTLLSPQEKREKRFETWLSPPDVKFSSEEAEIAYKTRVSRFIKTIKLEEPDRVPVMLPSGFLPAYYAGGTLLTMMYDYEKIRHAWKKFLNEFDMDAFEGPALVYPGKVLDSIDYKLFKWPGHGLSPEAVSYQYMEDEYMKADEYNAFIRNPGDFMLRTFMPRIVGALEPFRTLAPITPMMTMPVPYLIAIGKPEFQTTLQSIMEAGRETAKWFEVITDCSRAAREAGFPSLRGGGISQAPFDMIGDTLRGTQGIIMDMYRQPEKIIEAMETVTPMLIDTAIASSNASGNPIILMPLHKGDDAFMSAKQYETLYWPTFKKVLIGLINEGLVPMPFAEGKYNSRLEIIKDLPKGSVIWWFDQTDMTKAKDVLGNNACIAGNVPASILCTATPQEVKEYCCQLIRVAGKRGGFILAGAVGMDKGNPDNLRAMMSAVKECCAGIKFCP